LTEGPKLDELVSERSERMTEIGRKGRLKGGIAHKQKLCSTSPKTDRKKSSAGKVEIQDRPMTQSDSKGFWIGFGKLLEEFLYKFKNFSGVWQRLLLILCWWYRRVNYPFRDIDFPVYRLVKC